MSETVRVEFDQPRRCFETQKAWKLTAEGESDLFLPKSETFALERDDNENVVAAVVSEWVAAKRGLAGVERFVDDVSQENNNVDAMTRQDWYFLLLTCAFVLKCDDEREAPKQAADMMRRMDEQVKHRERFPWC